MYFNHNSGYIGSSRSVRSQNAIESFEVPISWITRTLLKSFLNEYEEDFEKDELAYLKTVSVDKWKYVATERMYATSWHHTGSYFKETDHYDLHAVAEKLIDVKETLDHDYNTYKKLLKKEAANIKYGVINVQEWGGTRNRPKLVGYDKVAGIIIGNWLFYKSNHSTDGIIKKYKTISNKVEWIKEYDSYSELVKNHKEYKSTKKVFSKIIAEKA